MKNIKIRKKDGSLLTGLTAELQAKGEVAVIYDPSIQIEKGDEMLTKKPSGRNRKQLIEEAYIDVVGGTLNYLDEPDTEIKAWVLFLSA